MSKRLAQKVFVKIKNSPSVIEAYLLDKIDNQYLVVFCEEDSSGVFDIPFLTNMHNVFSSKKEYEEYKNSPRIIRYNRRQLAKAK